ncbi:uncharacterized protein LOC109285233 [Alligator mississippiensis]|uniref:uncharacterized protein LOC109285233 n=1 Tax=Alligator mississippiensis TaxID=8496 RepID=UPI00287731E0|nr:uncharacterized protein LOC109285233 [Alligator mississippiensis]
MLSGPAQRFSCTAEAAALWEVCAVPPAGCSLRPAPAPAPRRRSAARPDPRGARPSAASCHGGGSSSCPRPWSQRLSEGLQRDRSRTWGRRAPGTCRVVSCCVCKGHSGQSDGCAGTAPVPWKQPRPQGRQVFYQQFPVSLSTQHTASLCTSIAPAKKIEMDRIIMPDGTIVTTVTTIQSRPKVDCKLDSPSKISVQSRGDGEEDSGAFREQLSQQHLTQQHAYVL